MGTTGEPLREAVVQLRQAVGGPAFPADAELLEQWLRARDQDAFTLLVRRHGPLVLGVCRRLLHDMGEAEDAAQAVFLILARKAASIGRRQALAAWLYRVAYRVAVCARVRLMRRPLPAGQLHEAAVPPDDPVWRDLRPVLDEEVSRLPEKYRTAFVLCHLQGHTNEEAASLLGCPVGTVLSRLSRARERLRVRLTRRGVTLSTAALAAALSEGAGQAALAPGLAAAWSKSAVSFLSGAQAAGSLPSGVIQLAEVVMRTMWMQKLRIAAVALLVVAASGVGTSLLAFRLGAADPPAAPALPAPQREKAAAPAAPAPAAAPGQGADLALKKALLETARKVYEQEINRLKGGLALPSAESQHQWSRRWMDAQLDLAKSKEERLAAFQGHLQRMRDLERLVGAFARAGQARDSDARATEFFRTQAELWLRQAQAKGGAVAPRP